jgi:hypothetical protein
VSALGLALYGPFFPLPLNHESASHSRPAARSRLFADWDPLGLADADFWSEGNDATWGFLRHAEIKHGRVAMFAFCGYCAQANGIHFPYFMGEPTSGVTPEEQWFNLPVEGRAQIIGLIGFLEFWGELEGPNPHYMRGGKPGVYPSFENFPQGFYPLPKKISLYDPFGIAAKDSDEKKAKGLLAEINNGRLAMIGIMGFMAEAKVPGSVPALTGLIKPFAGDVMAPLA